MYIRASEFQLPDLDGNSPVFSLFVFASRSPFRLVLSRFGTGLALYPVASHDHLPALGVCGGARRQISTEANSVMVLTRDVVCSLKRDTLLKRYSYSCFQPPQSHIQMSPTGHPSNSPFSQIYDYIVIGGGTAGPVTARRLADADHTANVLIIEAGPASVSSPLFLYPSHVMSL